MKKFLSLALILCLALTGIAVADGVRDTTLGNPILNLQDTAVLTRYAALLQTFPNSIFARFNGTADYQRFGATYKVNDLFGLSLVYEANPTGWPGGKTFDSNGVLGGPWNFNMSQVAAAVYGGKIGNLLFGAAVQTFFYDPGSVLSTRTYDTNTGKATYQTAVANGFISVFKPSIALEIAGMNVALSVDTVMDFTGYIVSDSLTNGSKWKDYITSPLFYQVGATALLSKDVSDTIALGGQVQFKYQNDGYSFQSLTNGKKVYPNTNSFVGGVTTINLALGSKIKATENTTFFVDLLAGLESTSPQRAEGTLSTDYDISDVWTIPSVTLGAEFELLKNLKLRASVIPEYQITVNRPARIKGYTLGAAQQTTTVTAFNTTTCLGLGYKIGAFVINWRLNTLFLDTALQDPLAFADLTGHQGVSPTLSSEVQANFLF